MKKISVRDIAKIANVSPATVSLALNNKAGVNEATRKHVLNVARKNNYTPPATSHAVAGRAWNNLRNIAIIRQNSPSAISEVFHIELNKSIIDACEKQSYNAVFTSMKQIDGMLTLPDIIEEKEVAGIICLGDVDDYTYGMLSQTGLPTVLLDCSTLRGDRPGVYTDYFEAARTATNYLLELGHRDIAYIGNEEQHQFNMIVFNGFQAAMREYTLGLHRIQMNVYDEQSLLKAMDTLFSTTPYPTALFCATDLHAIFALNYLINLGIRVPQEISIIGVDDLILSKYVNPALTTIQVKRVETGTLGVELLQKLVRGESAQSIVLPSNELIVRNTTSVPYIQEP